MAGELQVQKIARQLTAKQFQEWELYASMEPFGEMRADWRAASIRSMVFNMAVPVKDRKPMSDFLLKFEEVVKKPSAGQSWQEKKAIALSIAAAYADRGKTKEDSTARASMMADAVMKSYLAKGA